MRGRFRLLVPLMLSATLAGCLGTGPTPGGDGSAQPGSTLRASYDFRADRGVEQETNVLHVEVDWEFPALDEAGAIDRLPALKGWFAKPELAPQSFSAFLISRSTGCPVARESQGLSFAGHGLYERGFQYFLDDGVVEFTRPLAGYGRNSALSLLLLASMLIQQPGAVADAFQNFVEAPRVRESEGARELIFDAPGASAREPATQWRLLVSTEATSPSGLPGDVRWEHTEGGRAVDHGSLVRKTIQGGGSVLPLGCVGRPPALVPRVTPRVLGEADFPPRQAVPQPFGMREAFDEARNASGTSPKLRQFLEEHPDARIAAAYSIFIEQDTVPSQPAATDTIISWTVTFASPKDGVAVDVDLERTWHAGAPIYVKSTRVWPIRDLRPGLPTQAAWATQPLVSFEDALALAGSAGLRTPNRSGWSEPPVYGEDRPTWRIEYYHPRFSHQPDAGKFTLWFDARTGWLTSAEMTFRP